MKYAEKPLASTCALYFHLPIDFSRETQIYRKARNEEACASCARATADVSLHYRNIPGASRLQPAAYSGYVRRKVINIISATRECKARSSTCKPKIGYSRQPGLAHAQPNCQNFPCLSIHVSLKTGASLPCTQAPFLFPTSFLLHTEVLTKLHNFAH